MEIQSDHVVQEAPDAQGVERFPRTLPRLYQRVLVYLVLFGMGVALYAGVLRSFFIFDDLSHISKVYPGPTSWWHCFRLWNNGFWRPLVLLENKGLLAVFGLSPLPFHLVSVAVHALAGLLTWRLYAALHKRESGMAILAGVLLMIHFGAWACVASPACIADEFVAVAFLGGLLAWNAWITTDRPVALAGVFVCLLLAAMSKESAIVFPILLVLWAMMQKRATKRMILVLSLIFLFVVVYSLLVLYRQMHTASYLKEGRMPFRLPSVVGYFGNYMMAAFVPFLRLRIVRVFSPLPPGVVLKILRWCIVLLSAAACVVFIRRGERRLLFFPLLAASVVLVLPSLVQVSYGEYYLYSALPFVSIFLISCVETIRGRRGERIFLTALGAVFAFQVLGFYLSPTVLGYETTARHVEHLVECLRAEAPRWGQRAEVVILDHPHPGQDPWRWGYCQEIMDIFVPDSHALVRLDPDEHAAFEYRFQDDRLVLIRGRKDGRVAGDH